MNWQIIFSTYVNTSKKHTPQKQVEDYLMALAKTLEIQGFSLSNQLGYWAGELEQSHVLTLLDTNKKIAFKAANLIKGNYSQDAVIVKPVEEQVYFV